MRRFFPYFRQLAPYKHIYILGVVAGIIHAVATGFGLPFMVEKIFPIVFSGGTTLRTWELLGYAAILPAVFFIRGLSGYANTLAINYVGLQFVRWLRNHMFAKIQALHLGFFSKRSTGEIHARLTQDTQLLQQVITESANDLIRQPVVLMGAFGFLVYQTVKNDDLLFILLAALTIPICVLPIRLIGKRMIKKARIQQDKAGNLSELINENLSASREIRAYGLEEKANSAFQSQMKSLAQAQYRVLANYRLLSPLIEWISTLGIGLALFFAARNGTTLDQFTALVMALYLCYDPVKKLGVVHNNINRGTGALDRIEAILNEPITGENTSDAKTDITLSGKISFHGVSFGYGDKLILEELNLDIPAGQTVAIVGPSGAGKSSFVSMVPRFFDPTDGEIRFDDQSAQSIHLHTLRQHIALVSQEPILFQDSLRENIRMGRPDATDDEVEAAARAAHIHDFILSLPHGYDSSSGERGSLLSGGQKQRIALARAFLRQAPVLILDEATSALDLDSELAIQKALKEISQNRTVLIVAHRFSTIRDADRILLFDQGRIVADGSPDSLMEHPLFRRLHENQSFN